MLSWFRRRQIAKLLGRRLSEEHLRLIADEVALYSRLSEPLRRRLEQIAVVMMHRCPWEGCEGLEVTEEMKALISGHAAVMLLGAENYYFDTVGAILLFPDVIRREDEEFMEETVGEAWDNGGVVLSWPEVQWIGRDDDSSNVVIHEFAHHLDGLDGDMAGSIPFNNPRDQARWDRIAAAEYRRLVRDVRHRRPTLLDPYGASDRAEFFAVCSECFFQQPDEMKQIHPELFELLTRFYQYDPTAGALDGSPGNDGD